MRPERSWMGSVAACLIFELPCEEMFFRARTSGVPSALRSPSGSGNVRKEVPGAARGIEPDLSRCEDRFPDQMAVASRASERGMAAGFPARAMPGACTLKMIASPIESPSKSTLPQPSSASVPYRSSGGWNAPSARHCSGASPRKARSSPSNSPQRSARPSPSRSATPRFARPESVCRSLPEEASSRWMTEG